MKIPCPTCSRETYDFCIVKGRCDRCRNEADRAAVEPYTLTIHDVRDERRRRLTDCDWWELPSVIKITSSELFEARMAYRQALRDLPDTVDLENIDWPIPPG